jgi:hypothetical protein
MKMREKCKMLIGALRIKFVRASVERKLGCDRNRKMKKYLLFGIFIGVLIAGFYYFLYADKYGLRKDKYGYFKELTAVVYKTPNCNCCENYISYLRSNGFKVEKKKLAMKNLQI